MILVGYARVSSTTERQTTDLQHDALLAAGVDPRHLFTDHMSGASTQRPGLAQALAYLQPLDCLLVWKLDRLGRSLSHLLQIINDLAKRDIAFRSLTEAFLDTTTAQGKLLLSIFGALGEFERALTQERIKAGLAAAKRRGKQGGRPHVITAETLAQIQQALQGGTSKAAVCRIFGLKRTTLYDALRRTTNAAPERTRPD